MTTTANKVKFGLKNVYYATATVAEDGTFSYSTPVAIKGAVKMSLKHKGDSEDFYADDAPFYTLNNNNGYSGDFEFALVPDQLKIDCMGYSKDSNNSIYEDANAEIKPFALMYEVSGDASKTKFVYYNCSASRPDDEADTTGEKKTVKTEKLTISAKKRPDGKVKFYTTPDTPSTVSDAWYTKVQEPTTTTVGA
jgi:phi13 family phage major tail protein